MDICSKAEKGVDTITVREAQVMAVEVWGCDVEWEKCPAFSPHLAEIV